MTHDFLTKQDYTINLSFLSRNVSLKLQRKCQQARFRTISIEVEIFAEYLLRNIDSSIEGHFYS